MMDQYDAVVLPWSCSGCGEGHNRERTYRFGPDWYVCACGVTTTGQRVAELRAALDEELRG